MRKNIFAYAEIFFSCAQKFFSFRTAGNFRSQGAVLPSEEKGFFLRKERTFPLDGGELSFGRKFIFLRKEKYFRV